MKDVFLPWYNAYRFLVQNAKRLEVEGLAVFSPINQAILLRSSNVLDHWIQSATESLVIFVRQEMDAYRLYTVGHLWLIFVLNFCFFSYLCCAWYIMIIHYLTFSTGCPLFSKVHWQPYQHICAFQSQASERSYWRRWLQDFSFNTLPCTQTFSDFLLLTTSAEQEKMQVTTGYIFGIRWWLMFQWLSP